MKLVIFIISCAVIGHSFAKIPLPSYFEKCSKSDKKGLNGCILKNAAKAIPRLIQGDESLDFPSLLPLKIPDGACVGKDFTIHFKDIISYSFKTFEFLSVHFNLTTNKVYFTAYMEDLSSTGKYTVEDGGFLGRTFSGSGDYSSKYTGNDIEWETEMEFYNKDDEKYLRYINKQFTLTHKEVEYYFENLKTPEGDDMNIFINKNGHEFAAEIQQSIDDAISYYINLAIDNVLERVPYNDLFIP